MENSTFEEKIKNLEKIVSELEKGDLGLDDSIQKFEQGITCAKHCNKILEEAEKKITLLVKTEDEISEENFITDDN